MTGWKVLGKRVKMFTNNVSGDEIQDVTVVMKPIGTLTQPVGMEHKSTREALAD